MYRDYIQKVPDNARIKYCLDILSENPSYLKDEEKTKNLIREALRQLDKFFSKPRISFEDTEPINKGNVAIVEEVIVEDKEE